MLYIEEGDMKKTFLFILVVLFFMIVENAFAEGTAEAYGFMLAMAQDNNLPAQHAIARDMANNHMSELSSEIFQGDNYEYTRLTCYILATDKDNNLYLYKALAKVDRSFDGPIEVYQNDEKLSVDAIREKASEATEIVKIIDDIYVIYRFGSSYSGKYYLKTPHGDYYSLNKLVKKVADSASFERLDDFLN